MIEHDISKKIRNKKIEECKASGDYTIVHAINFTDIMICGANHKEIAEKLQADLIGSSKAQEILLCLDYEKNYGCIITKDF